MVRDSFDVIRTIILTDDQVDIGKVLCIHLLTVHPTAQARTAVLGTCCLHLHPVENGWNGVFFLNKFGLISKTLDFIVEYD